MQADILLNKYIDLYRCVHTKPFDAKRFAGLSKNYADLYKSAEAMDRAEDSGRIIGELTMRIGRFFEVSADEAVRLINASDQFPMMTAKRASDVGDAFLVMMEDVHTGLRSQVEVPRIDIARMGQ